MPSWADQWGEGCFGATDDEDKDKAKGKKRSGSGKKIKGMKATASVGLDKAKATAIVGAQKVKSGSLVGIKWIETQYQKRSSSK